MPLKSKIFLIVFLIFIPICSCGCSLVRTYQKSQEQKKLDIQLKKDNYMALKRDIAINELRNGTPAADIKAKYGSPDDIFYSGSSISSFQIWTYYIQSDKFSDITLTPIILYIENDKLVNWKS